MPVQLVGNRLKVYEYLKKISPQWATYEDLEKATDVRPYQQIFQIINLLKANGLIVAENGHFRENEWAFSVQPSQAAGFGPPPRRTALNDRLEVAKDTLADENSPAEFGRLAESVLGRRYGFTLHKGVPLGIPKMLDLVSDHGEVAGDIYFGTPGQEENYLPAQFSAVSEKVWLLEKTPARRKFLVFGNQREVPVEWLNRFGHLATTVAFYFLPWGGELEVLKADVELP